MKRRQLLLSVGLSLWLCACATDTAANGNPSGIMPQNVGGIQSSDGTPTGSGFQDGGGDSGSNGLKNGNGNSEASGLRILYNEDDGCYNENGYYYLIQDDEKLADGRYGAHLMYMDFASLQEVYLCSNTACSHNTPDCPSVFTHDDFPYATALFLYKDALYILSKTSDNDGNSYSMSFTEDAGGAVFAPSEAANPESNPATLYRANLDGTNRQKIYTFPSSVTLEDLVLGDENGIYVIAKEVSTERDGSNYYTTSSNRSLVFVDLESKSERTVCSMDFGDNISQKVVGCYGNNLVLQGIDYGRTISREEMYNDDIYRDLYLNSYKVFYTLDINNATLTERCRLNNRGENSALSKDNMLYLAYSEDGTVKSLDLNTGAEKTLCTLTDNHFFLWTIIGDKLCCHDKNWNKTFYYVDRNTGEISHSGLVNKSLGWSLDFRAVLESDVLVIYDYEATPSEFGDGAYEISLYQYGLISHADLFAGNDNYRKIQMVGKGW